jgi:glyoxylase-like metal-dependent hydrolase (beta-lactamase superfamily II)
MVRFAIVALAAACSDSGANPPGDGSPPLDTTMPIDMSGELEPGSLAVAWMHGSANCNQNSDPELQVHAYNATVHIARQNKCDTFEAPFIYVVLGATTALVVDSGATMTPALRMAVQALAGARAIVVAHSHSHGDHVAGDGQFAGQPNTTVVGRDLASIQSAFAIATWPDDPGQIDLGDRIVDVFGIPGHERTHLAFYDRRAGLLLTGDTLYPGMLFVANWTDLRTSVMRLSTTLADRPIAHVLGAHIEMTSTPRVAYNYGETFQPDEHVLQLAKSHLVELATSLEQLGPNPPAQPVVHDDFIIVP